MLEFLESKVDYPLHHLLGFDPNNIPLESFSKYNNASSSTLISALFTEGEPNLAIIKRDRKTSTGNKLEFVQNKAKELEDILIRNNNPIPIQYALIHMVDEDLQRTINESAITTLNNKYIFLKCPINSQPKRINDFVFEFQLKNLSPVLFFPERHPYFNSKIERLERLNNRGAVFQIDWLSLTGFYGKDAKKAATYLLKIESVKFIGFERKNILNIISNKGLRVSKKTANLLTSQLFAL